MSIVGLDPLSDMWQAEMMKRYQETKTMGIGETAQSDRQQVADIRIEKIENGYLVVYSKSGTAQKRKYAKDLADVGEVTKQACIELELTGTK